jgi:hypothetical protein
VRRGFSVHELLISLGVLGGVLALATHFAFEQQRFFRGVSDVAAVHSQLTQAGDLLGGVLWSISPPTDLVVAGDSAIEVRAGTGTAVACGGSAGQVVIAPPGGASGPVFSAFTRTPGFGDDVHVLFADSLGTGWLRFHVAEAPRTEGGCPGLEGVYQGWTIRLLELVAIPVGAVLRFTRPMRFSLYRSSDGRWYLGARDWNAALAQFNTVQPIAGPLEAWSPAPEATGLRFAYFDRAGRPLPDPVDPRLVWRITIVLRSATRNAVRVPGLSRYGEPFADSLATAVALRNAR